MAHQMTGVLPDPVDLPKRRRLKPAERERQIVDRAIRYFATHGFSGNTRDLAGEIGVEQSLLYRYFPNKSALIDRVVEEVLFDPWKTEWERMLADRSLPIRERVYNYYKDYARTILRRDWIRLFFFAGLTREDVNVRYLTLLRTRVFEVIAQEIRIEYGITTPDHAGAAEAEINLVYSMQATIFYYGIRRWLYGFALPENLDESIGHTVDAFFIGLPAVMQSIATAAVPAMEVPIP